MLSTEEAKTRLDSLRDPRWRTRALARVGKLRRRLREPALTFLQSPQAGQGAAAFEHHRQRRVAAARKFDELPDGQRVSVMEALHPGLGAALARWWVDAQGRPYQRGWDRRAFRAADSPGLTVEARGLDLAVLIALAGPFQADPVWLAGWGGHLATGKGPMAQVSLAIGGVLASAIDLGGRVGEETLAALMAVGSGEHPAGVMGRHVIVGLLGCSRQEGWDYIGRLLLAAQRQEGLRQAILEAADEGHPAAFDHILGLVLDHRLLRFAAAVRAAGVWLGFGAFVADIPQVEARVRKLAAFRADAAGRSRALAGDDPWDAYLALCARGMHDVLATIPEAKALSHHASPDVRAAALRYAAATGLLTGQHMLVAALDDPDIRVASLAAVLLAPAGLALDGVFDALTRLIPRLPAKTKTAAGALGVEAAPARLSSARAAGLLVGARGQRPAGALVPWLPRMCVSDRARAAMQIADEPVVTAGFRPVLVGLLSDRSAHVRRQALRGLSGTRLASSEAPAVEALLTRTATDVRRAALTLLASLPPEAARASASRLAASSNAGQRRAAAELPGVLEDAAHENVPDTLPDPQARTRPLVPRATRGRGNFGGGVARRIVEALDAIAHEHRNTPVLATWWQGSREFLFGDIRWFPMPAAAARPGVPPAGSQDDGRGMVLGEVFRDWWDRRPDELRDEDGLDALRAYAMAQVTSPESPFIPGNGEWCRSGLRELTGPAPRNLRHPAAVRHVVSWLAVENASAMVIGECLDALEASLARIPRSALTAPASNTITKGGHVMTTYRGPHSIPGNDWRHHLACNPWLTLLRGLLRTEPGLFSPAQITRWYRLMRWVEQPRPDAVALPVDEALLIAAHDIAAASEADVVAAFLQPRNMLFRELTRRWRGRMQARHPGLTVIADKVRDHLIRTELDRGDLPTPTSPAVLNIRSTCGAALAVEILRLVGQAPLVRGHALDSDSRDVVFSHLLRVSFPAPADAPTALSSGPGSPAASSPRSKPTCPPSTASTSPAVENTSPSRSTPFPRSSSPKPCVTSTSSSASPTPAVSTPKPPPRPPRCAPPSSARPPACWAWPTSLSPATTSSSTASWGSTPCTWAAAQCTAAPAARSVSSPPAPSIAGGSSCPSPTTTPKPPRSSPRPSCSPATVRSKTPPSSNSSAPDHVPVLTL
ncbi:MAG TPA: DUF5724 domain-containing protein [Streptosporangiaceae bacterium]|nr:DUF5724 domain-containing protein [Streptosporangiaceae bacterium]